MTDPLDEQSWQARSRRCAECGAWLTGVRRNRRMIRLAVGLAVCLTLGIVAVPAPAKRPGPPVVRRWWGMTHWTGDRFTNGLGIEWWPAGGQPVGYEVLVGPNEWSTRRTRLQFTDCLDSGSNYWAKVRAAYPGGVWGAWSTAVEVRQ